MDLTFFYIFSFVISVLFLIWYINDKEQKNINLLVMLIFTTFANGGYLALASSTNVEEALLANKITYIGGCFLPMLLFFSICKICKLHINNVLKLIMSLIQALLYLFICTAGRYDIYYRSVELHHNGYTSYLTKEYGPAHALYPITMYFYFLACIVVIIYCLSRKNVVSYKDAYLCLATFVLNSLGYILERALHLPVEIMPFIYTISFVILLKVSRRNISYSMSGNINRITSQNLTSGYIAFNKHLQYMGSNDIASQLLPAVKHLNLDEAIPYGDNILYHRIKPSLEKYIAGSFQSDTVKVGSKTYELLIHTICNSRRRLEGYMVELSDITDRHNYTEMIENYNKNLESEVFGKTAKIREIQDKMILGMAQMVESRDLSTGGHIKRTSSVVKVFSDKLLKEDLGLTKEFLYYVQKSAPMHDLGKIAVDDAVLRKQGKFTDEEYTEMKKHSAAGAGIVKEILTGVENDEFVNIAVNVAHYHHEKVDGTGYPLGLKGDEIPMEAKIMALADVFDALVSKRCYKEAFSYDRAFSIISESLGTHFDAKLGEIFISCRPELETLYNDFAEE